MKDLYYICAQPSSYYYAWQVDAMLLSFQEFGKVNLKQVHIVSSIQVGSVPDEHFKKVDEKWSKYGVTFAYYEDTRPSVSYISSIRPHILEKHWITHPYLAEKSILYHDCDIALTKPIILADKFTTGLEKTCYVSDTKSYIGATYIDSKGHGLLEEMCNIVGISPVIVRAREEESGGAQYLLKPGIDAQYWADVYQSSEDLFSKITDRVHEILQKEPEWHTLQIWCADMWAVLWQLWKRGYTTPCHKDLEFTWGTQLAQDWEKNAIYHNAGVTGARTSDDGMVGPFYKSAYQHKSPVSAKRPHEKWASQRYYDLVMKSIKTTEGHSETTHIVVVATNQYFILGLRFIRQFWQHVEEKSIQFHFFGDVDPTEYVWPDQDVVYYPTEHKSWVDATNSKFDAFTHINTKGDDQIFYFDADTAVNNPFSIDWFQIGELVGGEHYGNRSYLAGNKGYDRNSKSRAYVPVDSQLEATYYYGAFFGGHHSRAKAFTNQLLENQQWDRTHLDGYEPAVNDESYINQFFHYNRPATVPCTEFRFAISDKGGMHETRAINKQTTNQLSQLKEWHTIPWSIKAGRPYRQ